MSYTYSKFLDNVEGNNSWSYSGNPGPANNYNLAAEKSVDGSDIPHALVASYVYQLPVGRGKPFGSNFNRLTDAVIGGWELSQIASFKQGIPISVSGSDIASYGGNPRPDVVGNVHVCESNDSRMVQHRCLRIRAIRNVRHCPPLLLLSAWSRLPELGYFDYEELGARRIQAASVPGGDV